MDRLILTDRERFWHPDIYQRDHWIKEHAEGLPKGSKVLDAGAGASKYRPFFAHCDYRTQDFCKYEGPLVKYVEPIDYVGDITSIPLPDQSLDAILCTEVIEHVVDPMVVLTEFRRLLKPGGRLFLTSPLLSHLHMEPYHYYGGFTRYWYEHWLPQKGFEVESVKAVGGPARAAIVFAQAFYMSWSAAEKKLGAIPRSASWVMRMAAKVFVHYLLPWSLSRFDDWLGNRTICLSYLVAAKRV